MTGEARLWRSWNTMRSRYATATPALIPEYERGGAGAQPGRLLKFHAPEIVFGIDSMAEAAHAAVRLGALRPLLVPGPTLDLDTPADRLAALLDQATAQHHGVTPLQALRPGVERPSGTGPPLQPQGSLSRSLRNGPAARP